MWAVVMDLPKKYAIDAEILEQKERMTNVYELTVHCKTIPEIASPGQFVQLGLPDGETVLRRPLGIALHDGNKETLTFFYRVVGHGTRLLASHHAGDILNVLGPLGHGFSKDVHHPLLVGGGMGLSPLLSWAKEFPCKADVLMGGKTAAELFWQKDFQDCTGHVHITTDDGSLGEKGFTVALLPKLLENESYDCIITCGPEIMMRSVAKIAQDFKIPCQVSLERRMGCGLGACLSCSIDGTDGNRYKVCKDGPVFWAEDVFSFD